jgi:glutamine amidotransferase
MKVTIVDYGLGNLWSVRNAFEFMSAEVAISSDPGVVAASNCLVLPGVGNFGKGMENLRGRGLVQALDEAVVGKSVPILGICLGMQLLADGSEEAPGISGLGWIPGQVRKFADKTIRLPHMGFNAASPRAGEVDFFPLVDGNPPDFYFVHSYCFHPESSEHILAQTTYGSGFVSAVRREGIVGVQFHPEKSQSSGLKLIADFLRFARRRSDG